MQADVVYRIDGHDRLVDLSPEWDQFALANDGPDMVAQLVRDRPIWDFITGLETRELYMTLFRRVRRDKVDVRVPFRCDSPTVRRFMELDVRPDRDSSLRVAARTLRVEERRSLAILGRHRPRSDQMLTMCSFCRRALVNDRWLEIEQAITELRLFDDTDLPCLSHGVCDDCEPMFRRSMGMIG